MSNIRVNTIVGVGSGGFTGTVASEGGATTTDLQQGLCKSWCNFDGTASGAAARDSFNVGSMTDNSTGNYTTNFTSNIHSTSSRTDGGQELSSSNGLLLSGSKHSLRWEVEGVNPTKGTFGLAIRRGNDTINRKQILPC